MTLISKGPATNQEVVPIVNQPVFSESPESRYAIGVFDGADVISDKPSPLVQAYLQLRANVYIDQIHVLEDEHRRPDGTELDNNDERSTHFVLFENVLGGVAVFGCLRLIEKAGIEDEPLPIEEFFPESFEEPVPQGGVEVSRFIVRHDESRQRAYAKLNLIRTGLAHALRNELAPLYATIERQFDRDLRSIGVPTTAISEPKFIEEYNTANYGIEIDKFSLNRAVGEQAVRDMAIDVGNIGGFWGKVGAEDERAKRTA